MDNTQENVDLEVTKDNQQIEENEKNDKKTQKNGENLKNIDNNLQNKGRKKKKQNGITRFFVSLAVVLAVIGLIVLGVYLLLDKVIIPKYLSSYGVYNMSDFSSMIDTMYGGTDESKFITNPPTEADKASAISKLKSVNFPTNSNGEIDYNQVAECAVDVKLPEGESFLEFTDKEIAMILNDVLQSGAVVENLQSIKSFDTVSMTVKQLSILPKIEANNTTSNSACINAIIMLDTANVRGEMAKNMDVPVFMVNLLIPQKIYVTCTVNVTKTDDGAEYSDVSFAINGATREQSKAVLNMLISFIFEPSQQMTEEKLATELGSAVRFGLDLLNDIEFSTNLGENKEQCGMIVYV